MKTQVLLISLVFSISLLFVEGIAMAKIKKREVHNSQRQYKKALNDYGSFKNLVNEVEEHRNDRLLSLDEFIEMAKKEDVVILDSRSKFRFERKHLKGAINLVFSDYTQANLAELIPDKETIILIYCNNNFSGDQVDLASKIAMPVSPSSAEIVDEQKPLMLALNLPVYINLYGYGYRNVYELDELVSVTDLRIEFEGSAIDE